MVEISKSIFFIDNILMQQKKLYILPNLHKLKFATIEDSLHLKTIQANKNRILEFLVNIIIYKKKWFLKF